MKTTGHKIKELRTKADLTLEQLAAKMKVSHTAVANWEKDEPTPSIRRLTALAQIFNTDVSFFLDKTISSPEEREQAAMEIKIKRLEQEIEILRSENITLSNLLGKSKEEVMHLARKILGLDKNAP